MLRFERCDPARESIVGWVHGVEAGWAPPPRSSYMQDLEIIFTDFTPR
jgi:hypothetical protein